MKIASQRGYILIATILLGFAISTVAIGFMQSTANTSFVLNAQNYQDLAQEAADSGITYANSCMKSGTLTWSTAMTPGTTCTGTSNGGSAYLQQNNQWRSTFSVSQPDAQDNVLSVGTVTLLVGGVAVKTYTATSKMNVAIGFETKAISSGESITNIKAQNTDCAIANGKLYCWGHNLGQIGDGTTVDRPNPTLIQGAIAGKTVTAVEVSDTTTCVVADGLPYCWGRNGTGQVGSGNTLPYQVPTANVPRHTSGVLNGHFVTDIHTSPLRMPATIPPWPTAVAQQHSCALRADGAVACWGNNGFRQLSTKQGFCAGVPIFGGDVCLGLEVFAYPNSNAPILVNGYGNAENNDSAPWTGKKAVRAAASSHDSCLLADGRMYCMGVEVPLNPFCSFPSPLMMPANVISVNLNLCNASFSGGYDMSSKAGFFSTFNLNNRVIDPESWNIGSNLACGMADTSFFCVGEGPTAGFQWVGSFKTPWQEIANADVTSYDNGDNENLLSLGLDGMYCVVDKGIAKCMTSLTSGLLYGGGAPIMSLGPININGANGPKHNIPTKIAAGTMHGCVVANGQLYCWGMGGNGRLASGNFNLIPFPSLTGTGGNTPIGTDEGTFAANGPVSTGDGHTCTIANGQLFCWGKDTYGQLGMDGTTTQTTPLAVPAFSGQYVHKVSAGNNHTCAIRSGQLYCWGLNSSGQLGIGSTANQSSPQHVTAFNGMRVTDVSAGVDSTCAIANGKAYCWGNNNNSKIGQGSADVRFETPQIVNGKGDLASNMAVTKISTGTNHTCAIANADAFCWGLNNHGQLGTNNKTNSPTPRLLTAGLAGSPTGPNNMRPSVSDISAGGDFSCGIFNGKAGCWGKNDKGQAGTGTESWIEDGTPYDIDCNYTAHPFNPNNCTGVRSMVGCGLLNLRPCGYKTIVPQTPHNNELRDQIVPTKIHGAAGDYYATQIDSDAEHTCALIHGNDSAANGNIWCWGAGANYRLGNGSTANQLTPVLINGGATIDTTAPTSPVNIQRRVATHISTGASSTCSVANAVVICWGNGADYRLGDGVSSSHNTPGVTGPYRLPTPYSKGPVF